MEEGSDGGCFEGRFGGWGWDGVFVEGWSGRLRFVCVARDLDDRN